MPFTPAALRFALETPGLDARRRSIVGRALALAVVEDNLVRRETGRDEDRAVFSWKRGEVAIAVDCVRTDAEERLGLRITEFDSAVFALACRRGRAAREDRRVAGAVLADIPSYWEAIIRYLS